MRDVRRFPTPKRVLFALHHDLLQIQEPDIEPIRDDLTDLEILVVLLEDRKFFQHIGFDVRAIAREAWKRLTGQKHGGASTIDMQFVRTKTGYREKTLNRKLYEILLAILLQFRMKKLSILRAYMSQMYLGHGIRGVSQAAFCLFNKSVWELDKSECATIAAMMVYPRPENPSANWHRKVIRRARYGLHLFDVKGSRYKKRF